MCKGAVAAESGACVLLRKGCLLQKGPACELSSAGEGKAGTQICLVAQCWLHQPREPALPAAVTASRKPLVCLGFQPSFVRACMQQHLVSTVHEG